MRAFLTVFVFTLLVAGLSTAEKQNSREPLKTYELYSWQDKSGDWDFYLTVTTSRVKTPEEIFAESETIHGVDKLKRKILHLVHPSRIVWIENLVYKGAPMKGTERLAWPPKDIIEEVRHYGTTKHIEVVGPA